MNIALINSCKVKSIQSNAILFYKPLDFNWKNPRIKAIIGYVTDQQKRQNQLKLKVLSVIFWSGKSQVMMSKLVLRIIKLKIK